MRRHDRVYLRTDTDFATPCAASGSPAWQAAADWIAAGRPLVAARQPDGDDRVQLGLSLSLAFNRQRLTIRVAPERIAAVRPPIAVRPCLAPLPPAMAAVLLELDLAIGGCGARLGIYGSLAAEALSGEAFRHADSDIDLICDVADRSQVAAALAAFECAAARLPCRLDGELRRPDGWAVAWCEAAGALDQPDRPVLVKGEGAPALWPLATWLAGLAAADQIPQPAGEPMSAFA
ncbi:MAG TPA: malonate decarboxylase holo-[acyl-carrier-protein] synthase [Azonexus sp.]